MDKKPVLFNKTLVIGIIFLFIGMSINLSTGTRVEKTSSTTSGSRGYIQDLIDNASDGDTIYVPSGIYYETIVIDKSINLIGDDKGTTIIDGDWSGDVVTISVDWVNISGLTIKNGFSPPIFGAGVMINSYYNTVTDNKILDNNYCGVGISSQSGSNTVSDNIITNNGMGVLIWGSSDNTIIDNNISGNLYGVDLIYSANHNIIADNTISSTSGYGIIIWHSSNHNIITGNRISWNGWGIKIESSSSDNIIYHNNIIQNNQNADDECSNIWDNGTLQQGNYWSDYAGSDNDGDAIGDTPYYITGGDNQDKYPLMHLYGPPYAKFTYNNQTSEFDGSLSGDYNGYIVTYEWDFGDGETGNGETIYHKYCEVGIYDVKLIVTDNDGLEVNITESVEVTVANPPLIPEISGHNSGKPGEKYEYSFILTDPDGDDFYLWVEWGDGDSTGWIGPYISGETVKLSHTWDDIGTYEIKAKIKDFCGESPWGSLEVTMPRSKAINKPLLNWLQSHPNMFPLLQLLLQRLGL